MKKRGVLDYLYIQKPDTATTVLGFLEKAMSFQLWLFRFFKSEISGETIQQEWLQWQGSRENVFGVFTFFTFFTFLTNAAKCRCLLILKDLVSDNCYYVIDL